MDLRVVLELSPAPDGRSHGEIDGVPLSLERDGRIRLPLTAGWPGVIVSLAEPDEVAIAHPALRVRSLHPGWMSAAIERALTHGEVVAALDAISRGAVRVEVDDHAVHVSLREELDGPSVRRTIKAVSVLARMLPSTMAEVVTAGVSADLRSRPREARRTRPARTWAAEEQLSQQYRRFEKRLARLQWGTFLGSPLVVVAFAVLAGIADLNDSVFVILDLALLIGTYGYGIFQMRRLRFTDACPRCQAPRLSRAIELVNDARCPSCHLGPLRPPRLMGSMDRDP